MTEKFRIELPGNFMTDPRFGQNYYAITKNTRKLVICGENAAHRILNQYDFWFDEESATEYGLQDLPRDYRNNEVAE